MALGGSLAGYNLLGLRHHDTGRGCSRLQSSATCTQIKGSGLGAVGQQGRDSGQEGAPAAQDYLYLCHNSGFLPVQIVEEAGEGEAGTQTQQLPRSDGRRVHGSRLGQHACKVSMWADGWGCVGAGAGMTQHPRPQGRDTPLPLSPGRCRPRAKPARGPGWSSSAPAPTGIWQPRPDPASRAQPASRGARLALRPGPGRGPAPVTQPGPAPRSRLGPTPPICPGPSTRLGPSPGPAAPLTPAPLPPCPCGRRRPGPDPGPAALPAGKCSLGSSARRPGGRRRNDTPQRPRAGLQLPAGLAPAAHGTTTPGGLCASPVSAGPERGRRGSPVRGRGGGGGRAGPRRSAEGTRPRPSPRAGWGHPRCHPRLGGNGTPWVAVLRRDPVAGAGRGPWGCFSPAAGPPSRQPHPVPPSVSTSHLLGASRQHDPPMPVAGGRLSPQPYPGC